MSIAANRVRRLSPARGNLDTYGRRSVSIRFEDDMFEALRRIARRKGTAFSVAVRELVQQSLDQDNNRGPR